MVKDYSKYRMYILVKDFPPSVAINSAVHGGMSAYASWNGEEDFDGWFENSFRKITCKVTPEQFEVIEKCILKTGLKKIEQIENRIGGAHVLTVVYPFDATLPEYKPFKFLSLYKGVDE